MQPNQDDDQPKAAPPLPTLDSEQFRVLADNIPTPCWIANADGYIVWYNRGWHDYCGTTPAQMQGWGWQSVHDPAVLPGVLLRWTDSIRTGSSFEMTFPLRGADGRYRPFLTRIQPVRDEAGTIQHWCGVNTDISAQQAAEQGLRAANARNAQLAAEREAILGQLAEGVVVTDNDGKIIFVNAAAAHLHGVVRLDRPPDAHSPSYSLLTMDGEPYPPADLPLARAVLLGQTVVEAQWRIRKPDGSEVIAIGNARPLHGPDDEKFGAVLTIRDDTRRHMVEAALRQSEAIVRAFFETVDMYQAVLDLDDDNFTCVTANRRIARVWGRESLDGIDARSVLGGSVAPDIMKTLHGGHAAGKPSTVEYPYLNADGMRWFVATLNPMPPGSAGKKRLSVASLDITARKQAEDALAQALETKDLLLHEVNHRVKNSLQLVSSLLSLQARQAVTPGLQQALGDAQARVAVVATMHHRLYATSQHDRTDFASYLREMARDTVAAFDRANRITLHCAISGALVLPLDTAVPLALVVGELLTNALKYAFVGVQAGILRVELAVVKSQVDLVIADDGVGLPAGFDMARAGGLGMRVVSVLSRQIGATIAVVAQPRGAGFRIKLPVA